MDNLLKKKKNMDSNPKEMNYFKTLTVQALPKLKYLVTGTGIKLSMKHELFMMFFLPERVGL